MTISEDIINAYLLCPYKGYLRLNALKGEINIFQEKLEKDNFLQIQRYQNYLRENNKAINILDGKTYLNDSITLNGYYLNFNIRIAYLDYSCSSINIKIHIKNGVNVISPVLITAENKVTSRHKILLTYQSYILQNLQVGLSDYGEIIYGQEFHSQKIAYKNNTTKLEGILKSIKELNENGEHFFSLNKHCKICEFNNSCHEKAIKADHLSLISTIKKQDIEQLNSKGIFTVNQLSYTFKPRRTPKRVKNKRIKHIHALKALAIQKQVIYVYDKNFELRDANVKLYLDIEGSIDENSYFLIGVVIEKDNVIVEKSYWISLKSEESKSFYTFLNDIEPHCAGDFIVFHYSKYEIAFLEYLYDTLPTQKEKLFVKSIINNCFDILPLYLYKIYLPVFSNDLKSISRYLGFSPSSEIESGLHVLLWRQSWEENPIDKFKDQLVQYNLDDCLALKLTTDFIYSVRDEDNDANYSHLKISEDFTDEIKLRYGGIQFGKSKFILQDYNFINKRAYFNYQQEKIYIRNRQYKAKIKNEPDYFKSNPNKIITKQKSQNCIHCGNVDTKISKSKIERTITDLKITKNGIRKWVVKFVYRIIYCNHCKKTFNSNEYKNIGKMYGHNLISWVIYQYVVNQTSFEKIGKNLEDFYQISIGQIGGRNIFQFKELAAEYYKEAYDKLINGMSKWDIVHADETRFRLRTSNGYVWVLTNMNTVIYMFRSDRTCTFLADILKDFNGILISDFYKGYESFICKQQKCLIHLLRDINDLLFKNQQNIEIRLIADNFSVLLKKIVSTIDKYGLKKRNLFKHYKDVNLFYKKIDVIEYKTKDGLAISSRLKRSRKNLFTFLSHDNVPWNNNNAEHSIKPFAIYRRQANGLFTQKGIEDYLILLSLYQTCKYRGISFWKFLLSKEKDLDSYMEKYTSLGNLRRKMSVNNSQSPSNPP